MGKLADIAKRLGVTEDALQGLYHELVKTDTGVDYAELAKQLNAEQPANTPVNDEVSQVAQLTATLAQKWNVTEDAANARLEQLNTVYERMSPAQQERYGSLEGIEELWNVVSVTNPTPTAPPQQQTPEQQAPQQPAQPVNEEGVVKKGGALSGISPAMLLNGGKGNTSFSFDDLVNMPEADYARIADSGQLLAAFENGNVRDTAVALRPGAVATSLFTGRQA